eukprot:CAMPEP_0194276960 /NCGR_PEP_ID=MMETSP0169-20130528/9413_1 /TAXON_ID=218684 /ORGANISM="Corethron pennatum, Strain L29A3" /LENGTH=223 /DNA_ID=CAMNT_0039020807 /DNA_START=112 /DNA_END=783 /DNA_ORIENTATION=-
MSSPPDFPRRRDRRRRYANELIAFAAVVALAAPSTVGAASPRTRASRSCTFLSGRSAATRPILPHRAASIAVGLPRGGSDDYDTEEIEEDATEEETEEEEDEEDEALLASLAAAQRKRKAAEKAKLSAVLKSIPKKKRKRKMPSITVPYLVRLIFRPLTVLAMTREYWRSLIDPAYPEIDSSEGLRSALEAKAKKNVGARRKPNRTMKPGQAKTLSDLPVLSA